MTIEQVTVVFVIGVFVAAEIYRAKRGLKGVIVAVDSSSLGPVALPVMTVRVRLESGDEVTAGLNCCTACLGRLQVGDWVRVADSRDGYVIDLPWFRGRKCGANNTPPGWFSRRSGLTQGDERTAMD